MHSSMSDTRLTAVLQALLPYLDQQAALSLRLTCSAAAAVCAQAVQELTYVLGSARTAATVAPGFVAALRAFTGCSSIRLFCMLRTATNRDEAAALFASLQQTSTEAQQQTSSQQQAPQLPALHNLILSEVKGQGDLQSFTGDAHDRGMGAAMPYLPLLDTILESLQLKCLRPPAPISSVLPRLLKLTALCLDSVMGFAPAVLLAVQQLQKLQQLTVCVNLTWLGERDQDWYTTTGGLEHLAPLTALTTLQYQASGQCPMVGAPDASLYFVVPHQLTALQHLQSVTFGNITVDIGSLTALTGQLCSLQFINAASARSLAILREIRNSSSSSDDDDGGSDGQSVQRLQGPRGVLQLQLHNADKQLWHCILGHLPHLTCLTLPSLGCPELLTPLLTAACARPIVRAAAAVLAAPTAVAAALAALAPFDNHQHTVPSDREHLAAAEAAAAAAAGLTTTLGAGAAAAAAQAAAAAVAAVLPQSWPVNRPFSTSLSKAHYLMFVANQLHAWSRPAAVPSLQRLCSPAIPPLGVFDPLRITALTLLSSYLYNVDYSPSSFVLPGVIVTNLQELTLRQAVSVAMLQQWLPHLPQLRSLDAALLPHPHAADYVASQPQYDMSPGQWAEKFSYPSSLMFPEQSQGLVSIRLAVPQRAFANLTRARQQGTTPQPQALLLVDLPCQCLTQLKLSNWVFGFSNSSTAPSDLQAAAAAAGPAAGCNSAAATAAGGQQPMGTVSRLPCQLQRFTFCAIPGNVDALNRPWPHSTPRNSSSSLSDMTGSPTSSEGSARAPAGLGRGSSGQHSNGNDAAPLESEPPTDAGPDGCINSPGDEAPAEGGWAGVAGPSSLRFAACLVWPPELSMLQANRSALQVLELFEVPLTDDLISQVSAACPYLTALVIDGGQTDLIECSLSASGLQPLSQLHRLRTLLLLPSLTSRHHGCTWNIWAKVVQICATADGQTQLAVRLAEQLSKQPWRKHGLAQEQQQLSGKLLPWCINGSSISRALSSLQSLHHLKIGLPFMPAQSVLQLSALRSLQLVDLGGQEFAYWRQGWEAAAGEPCGGRWAAARARKELMAQLEQVLPPQCRLLCWEGPPVRLL